MNYIVEFIINYGENVIMKLKDLNFEKMINFLKVIENTCYFKNLFNHLKKTN